MASQEERHSLPRGLISDVTRTTSHRVPRGPSNDWGVLGHLPLWALHKGELSIWHWLSAWLHPTELTGHPWSLLQERFHLLGGGPCWVSARSALGHGLVCVSVRSAPVQVFIKWWDVKYSFGAYLPQSGENVYIRVWLTGKGLYFLHH